MLPLAFLTILGDASADALGATAIVSMVPTWKQCRIECVRLYSHMLEAQGIGLASRRGAQRGRGVFLGLREADLHGTNRVKYEMRH